MRNMDPTYLGVLEGGEVLFFLRGARHVTDSQVKRILRNHQQDDRNIGPT